MLMKKYGITDYFILGDFNGGRMKVDPTFMKNILPSLTPFYYQDELIDPKGKTMEELNHMWDTIIGNVYEKYMISFMDVLQKHSNLYNAYSDGTPPITNIAGLEIDLIWTNEKYSNSTVNILATCELFNKDIKTRVIAKSILKYKDDFTFNDDF